MLSLVAEEGGNAAIVAGFEFLPLPEIAMAVFCFVCIVFCATTYDSASYTLASSATRELHPSEDPPRWHRTFWAVALAILPLTLMYIGGIKVAQTAVLVSSFPILLTTALSAIALVKSLRRDYPAAPIGEAG